MSESRFFGTYLIETPLAGRDAVLRVAEAMAGEQSTATFTKIAGETDERRQLHGARVEHLELLDTSDRASLPSVAHQSATRYQRARVSISWPIVNIGLSLPMLSTTLMGNQTGMRDLTGIRLEHIRLPDEWMAQLPGPAFGIEGTRRLLGVARGPMLGTIVKPNIGLAPVETGAVVRTLAEAGLDFVKDDELLGSPSYSPACDRIRAGLTAASEAAQRTGRQIMYAPNITGEVDEMKRRHDLVHALGGTCVMVNVNAVGWSGLLALRRHSMLPIHGHRAGWAAMTRAPLQGMAFQPYQVLCRLAGVDHMHVGGLGKKFYSDSETVIQSTADCRTPLAGLADRALPVTSGGSTVWTVRESIETLGEDQLMLAGGGMFGHPKDLAAGVQSFRDAIAAALVKEPIEAAARRSPDLQAALDHWPLGSQTV